MSAPSFVEARWGAVGRWWERQSAKISRSLPPPPFQSALSRIEGQIVQSLLAKNAAAITAARAACANGAGTRQAEQVAEDLVSELRARMECVPWDRPLLSAIARLDQQLPTSVEEIMDDARLDEAARTELVRVLDRQTRRAGDYLVLADLLEPLYVGGGAGPLVVLDIASGPGGFAIEVARAAGTRPVRVIASDVSRAYLNIGRAEAEAAGVIRRMDFAEIDALNLADDGALSAPDIVTCTRSLHHFGVGGTTRLLAQALRCARTGVLFVDIARSISRMLMAAGAGIASGNWRFAYDAVVSVRKSFTAGELTLIAACIPGGATLDIFYQSPAYVVARTAAGAVGDRSRHHA